jgi:hypothetical protein
LTPSYDRTSCQEFRRTRMAPILRRAGSVATGGKHREYRIECNHKGPRFVVSTTALQLWLNGKRNQGPCQGVFYNDFNCLRHLTPFDSNKGHLYSKWPWTQAEKPLPEKIQAGPGGISCVISANFTLRKPVCDPPPATARATKAFQYPYGCSSPSLRPPP